jgi:Zn-dependent protease with chaperone function
VTFFEHQRLARRNSRMMVVLFVLAVIAVVTAVDVAVGAVYVSVYEQRAPVSVYVTGAAVTAALILLVSLFNVVRLAEGGAAVARMVGARRVPPETTDPLERRLRNVVEEMAIASGVRVPEVYVMDAEKGINAFAAGWDVSGAVVAVTRGTLEALTRDELQGVVAHEFSHILNGDMRLNIRTLGVLAGIVFIGSIGEVVMRGSRGNGKNATGLLLAGAAIFVIGYVGLFFARLIKSALARQREFLADASSVQFTRNPDGIAGALDQIRSSAAGTLIANRYAEEMSHMFFGTAVKMRLAALFDTHPPLAERIRRVHPRFDRASYVAKRESAVPTMVLGAVERQGRRTSDLSTAWGRTPEESLALVGAVDAGKVEFAARLMQALPAPLHEALKSAQTAGAVIVALLLAEPEAARAQQLAAIPDRSQAEKAASSAALVRGLGAQFHLPVIDLALPAIKSLSEEKKKQFLAALEAVVNADRRVSLHELVALALVRDQLLPPRAVAGNRRLSDLHAEAATVLSLVAHAGTRADAQGEREAQLQAALQVGAAVMKIPAVSNKLELHAIHTALEALRALSPMEKGVLVKALFAAVTHDGTIRVAEAELMRLVGAVLDCPVPPLFDSLLQKSGSEPDFRIA